MLHTKRRQRRISGVFPTRADGPDGSGFRATGSEAAGSNPAQRTARVLTLPGTAIRLFIPVNPVQNDVT